ncbi:hypothetical protein H8356DRAFT_1340090 [Neocallimastix lanati (nom. inval.)]|nr:hypothetical protein H8356DRAFT_1340090 [Neocallimastix sp. JGI-2020a]
MYTNHQNALHNINYVNCRCFSLYMKLDVCSSCQSILFKEHLICSSFDDNDLRHHFFKKNLALERGPFQGGKGRTKNSMKLVLVFLIYFKMSLTFNCNRSSYKYEVSNGNKNCCGGLFEDDIVLIASNKLKRRKCHFKLNKYVTMIIKLFSFVQSHSFKDPTFHLGMDSIPKISCYIYLVISI